MCRRSMISASRTPVSTRIGPAGLPRMRTPQVGTRVRIPMLRASTRKLDSSSISISGRSLISWAGISILLGGFPANAKRCSLRVRDDEDDRSEPEHGSYGGKEEPLARAERRPLAALERLLHLALA